MASDESSDAPPLATWIAYVGAAGIPAALVILVFAEGLTLGFGEFSSPGPGMWPVLVGGVLGVLVTILCLRPGIVVSHTESATVRNLGRVGLAVVALGLFYYAFAYLGVVPAVVVSLSFWLRVLSRQSWLSTAVISVTTSVVLLVVFTQLLELPLSAFGRPL